MKLQTSKGAPEAKRVELNLDQTLYEDLVLACSRRLDSGRATRKDARSAKRGEGIEEREGLNQAYSLVG